MDVAGAKMIDWAAELDALQGLTTMADDFPYCEKGPITDPTSSFIFMLERRGSRKTDGAYSRGIDQALRLFVEWTLEKADNTNKKGPQFVLTHPDFAFQNFLVDDDGTLCGIIDWDGVAAVPLSVGCLKYPDWLIKDWNPWYQYGSNDPDRPENSPKELACYRIMYAQFVEAYLSIACGSGKASRALADTTRMSLVAGSLDLAANDLKVTGNMIDTIFEKVETIIAENDDVSDSDLGSSDETHPDDAEEDAEEDDEEDEDEEDEEDEEEDEDEKDEEDEVTEPTETEDSISGDGGVEVECLCRKCITDLALDKPPLDNVDAETDGISLSAVEPASLDSPELGQIHDGLSASSGTCIVRAAGSKAAVPSRKAKFTKWALNLGQKGCREMAKVFHKEEVPETILSRKTRLAKWALGAGQIGCKRASEVLHKDEEASCLQRKDLKPEMSDQKHSYTGSNVSKPAMCPSDQSEPSLKMTNTRLPQGSVPAANSSNIKNPLEDRIKKDMLGTLSCGPVSDNVNGASIPRATGGRLVANVTTVDTQHCKKCNTGGAKASQGTLTNGGKPTETDPDSVWALIAADVEKAGIPINLIKKRHDVIAQCVIQNLGQEIEQENENRLRLKNKKAARKAKKARQRAKKTNGNHESIPDVNQKSFVESDKSKSIDVLVIEEKPTLIETFETCMAEKPASATSEPERAACPESSFTAIRGNGSEAVVPDCLRSDIENSGFAGPESLISRLEFAKQRHDLETALKAQNLPSGNLGSPKAGVSGNLDQEEPSFRAINIANAEARKLLANLRELEAADTYFAQNIPETAECEDQDLEGEEDYQALLSTSVTDQRSKDFAAQSHPAVKEGRWFETPRGSLKRIEEQEKVDDDLDYHKSISPPISSFSENSRDSSKSSVASHGDDHFSGVRLPISNDDQNEAVNVFQVPKEGEVVDSGYFALGDICVALGNGSLDEQRLMKLKAGFMALLDDTIGVYRG